MPQLLIHGNHSWHRGETVCKKLATLTVRNLIFSRCQIWSIFTVFRYFSIFFDRFRSFSIVYTPGSVRKRSELFEAKIRGRMGVERAVLMCATRQYLSRAGGVFRAFFKFLELTSKFAWFFIRNLILMSRSMHWVPNLQCQRHFDEKAIAARRARVKNTRNFRKITAPHMRTALSTPNLCLKQFQGNATPSNTHFSRVLTRFAHILPASSRSIFTEIQEKSP